MNILFLGKPGSGKGTITQQLTDEGFIQLSTGDLLRAEKASGSELGKEIAAIPVGKFASDEIIFLLVDNFLKANNDKSIIFDGFPRNLSQAQKCLDNGIVFDKIFSIETTDEKVKERIVNRRVHPASGRVYNVVTMPPKVEGLDDITGQPLVHRDDDKLEVIEDRLKTFRELTLPIAGMLENKGYTVHKINGEAPLSEQISLVKTLVASSTNKKLKL